MVLGSCDRDVSAARAISVCFWQATRALHEILQQSSYLQEVEAFFHQLFLVLLFQISFTTELSPEEAEIWRECQGEESALSSAVRCCTAAPPSLLWAWEQGQGCRCDLGFALHTGSQCGR